MRGTFNHNWREQHQTDLQSKAWLQRRQQYIEDHGYNCENTSCGKSENLELHHTSYNYVIGTEPDEELILHCDECHNNDHSDQVLLTTQNTPEELKECPSCSKLNKEGVELCRHCKQVT